MPRTGVAFVLLAVLSFEGAAFARDPVAAEGLFQAGREALKREEWASACVSFAKSQELDPAAGTALNLALCEEKQGHIASAWQRLREAIDLLPPGDDRAPAARKRVAELEPRVPHLTVLLGPGAPPGTRVRRDDLDVDGALLGFPQPIDPGRHVVRVSAPGWAERVYDVTMSEAQRQDLVVVPGAQLPPSVASLNTSRRTIGWVFSGIGATAIGLGAVTGLAVISRSHERQRLCPNDVCPTPQALADARSVDSSGNVLSVVSTVAFAVGAVGLAAGLYFRLWPTKESSKEQDGAHVAVAPSVSRGAGSLSVSGSF
jgi:hypothetical protein